MDTSVTLSLVAIAIVLLHISSTNAESSSPTCRSQITGDPHFTTFDGLRVDFQGHCKYILMNVTLPPPFPQFLITSRFVPCADREDKVTCVLYIEIKSDSYSIRLYINGTIMTNGQVVKVTGEFLDYPGIKLAATSTYVKYTGGETYAEVNVQCSIDKDQYNYGCTVDVTKAYGKHIEGILGDCNDDPSNDGNRGIFNATVFDRYYIADDENIGCSKITGAPTKCDDDMILLAKSKVYCGLIVEKQSVFKRCNSLSSQMMTTTFDNCIYDVCHALPGETEAKKLACAALSIFATFCIQSSPVVDWRPIANCPMTCPDNSKYVYNASPCQPSCLDREPECDGGIRQEACVCEEDYVFEYNACQKVTICDRFPVVFAHNQDLFDAWFDDGSKAKDALDGSPVGFVVYNRKGSDHEVLILSYNERNNDQAFESTSVEFDISGAYPTGCFYSMYTKELSLSPNLTTNTQGCNPRLHKRVDTDMVSYDNYPTFHVKCATPAIARHIHITWDRVDKKDERIVIQNIIMRAKVPRPIVEARCPEEFPRYVIYNATTKDFKVVIPGFIISASDKKTVEAVLEGSDETLDVPMRYRSMKITTAKEGGKFIALYTYFSILHAKRIYQDQASGAINVVDLKWKMIDQYDAATISGLSMEACLPSN